MAEFLFAFGYETPTQHRNNEAHGWDDEDSHAVFIDAPDGDAAMAWGREIAESFVERLWSARGEKGYSWKAAGFAHWIETDPERITAARKYGCPRVAVGEHPALAD